MALSWNNQQIGIDLGTANTCIYVEGRPQLINEPSVVSRNKKTGEIIAIGKEAYNMIGRTPENIETVRPLKDGVIADYELTAAMLHHFINSVGIKRFVKPDVMICVPSGVTPVEQKAVRDAAKSAGAREAYVVEEPFAAAVGAGLDVSSPVGSMIVDIGGGTTDVATISMNGIVRSQTIRVGGDKMDEAIIQIVRDVYNLHIGLRTAEQLKFKIGVADKKFANHYESMSIRGRDIATGLPKRLLVEPSVLADALKDIVHQIIVTIKEVLEQTPPEITSDVIDRGIVLTGGGALLHHIADVIVQVTKVPVFISDRPLECVALGTGILLQNPEFMNKRLKDRV
ncbi:rod shape-determining protein [Atopobacter phocae]|uniref:rod shape-determining protein n=1 Tax=Atopobacter phocae TaxID=136492 RepID=UPI000472FC6B|nr:rod shape-determining protein [Atopobacter phocae]